MFKLLLVDDHDLFREGLQAIICHWDDFEVVGEACSGREAIDRSRELRPDIVLMDIEMPSMSGVEATEQIMLESPTTVVVMLTMSDRQEDIFQALKNGARGYILKDTPSRRLHDMLALTMEGEATLSGPVAAKILEEFSRDVRHSEAAVDEQELVAVDHFPELSEREYRILALITSGLSNSEIAERLYLSENTIKKHIGRVLEKLHVKNRVQAAVYATQRGLKVTGISL